MSSPTESTLYLQENGTEDSSLWPYRCGLCPQVYQRADHLVRHVRTHSKRNMYACRHCQKSFVRIDIMKRHEKIHSRALSRPPNYRETVSDRVNSACRQCATRKLKCSNSKPCERCNTKGVICDFDSIDADSDMTKQRRPAVVRPQFGSNNPTTPAVQQPKPPTYAHDLQLSPSQAHPQLEKPCDVDGIFAEEPDLDRLMFSQDYHMQLPANINFDMFQYEDAAFSIDFRNSLANQGVNVSNRAVPGASVRFRITRSAIASDSLNKSAFVRPWKPQRTQTLDEYTNFTLPHEFSTKGLLPETLHWQPVISHDLRDCIMGMVPATSRCGESNGFISRSGSFPPPAVLSDFLKLYSTENRPFSLTTFIHIPNFKSEDSLPELVAAMIVKGGIEASSPHARKFCSALQQVIMYSFVMRVSLKTVWHFVSILTFQIAKDPVWMKELDFAQAYFLVQHVGFYSGSNLKIEVAKMCASPCATLIRQMAALSKANNEQLDLISMESSISLEQLWHKWSREESVRRLSYFAWILQAQSSLVFDVNIPITPSEMHCPLPAGRDLWDAKSASEWWSANPMASHCHHDPSLKDLMRDPALLVIHRCRLDVPFAQLALLGGCWALIREYRQFCALACEQNNFDSIVLMSRRKELVYYLERVHMECIAIGPLSCEVDMFYQVAMMHIYVSFRDLEIFAGRESDLASTKMSEEIIYSWAQGPDAWHAVYYAGQVIRAAENFAVGTLSDFYTIAFFQAVLLLWTYGIFQQEQHSISSGGLLLDAQMPWLSINTHYSTEHGNFKTCGKGYVGLSVNRNDFVPLKEPASIVKWAMALLDNKCKHILPTMINQEFARLLQDLHEDTVKNQHLRP